MTRWRSAVLAASMVVAGATVSIGGPQPAWAAGCSPGVPGDVNGDGYAEAAVSEFGYAGRFRGAVHVFYGSAAGVRVSPARSALDDQYLDQDSPGVPGRSEDEDAFGRVTAFGDFDGDRCADLAIAVPGENLGVGGLVVLYGSPTGIRTSGAQSFSLRSLFGLADGSEFADDLEVADLDGDRIDDLVVASPGHRAPGDGGTGTLAVLYGDADRLTAGRASALVRAGDEITPTASGLERFGSGPTAGDFDGDGDVDLAVGVNDGDDFGVIDVLNGGDAGVGSGGRYVLAPDRFALDLRGGTFGTVHAAGDVDGDGRADLAVGTAGYDRPPEHDDETFAGPGAVVLVRGSARGLTTANAQLWTQDSPGVGGVSAEGDGFGSSLAMGRFDSGPSVDLAVGAPGDADRRGSVTLLMGDADGLTTAGIGGSVLTQNSPGVAGRAESGDAFGVVAAARSRGPVDRPT